MAASDISFLPEDLRAAARFWSNGEVMWPKALAERVIGEIADSGRIIYGLDVESYADDGTFMEAPWSACEPDRSLTHQANVERAREAALAAVARIEPRRDRFHDDWINMNWSAPSTLTESQRALLDFLLAEDFPGRVALLEQSQHVETSGLSCDCGCPSFYLNPDRTTTAPAEVDNVVPIDAHTTTADGLPIEVLLFVRDGYLSELEIVWYGETPPAELPSPQDLVISQWSEPDESGGRVLLNP